MLAFLDSSVPCAEQVFRRLKNRGAGGTALASFFLKARVKILSYVEV